MHRNTQLAIDYYEAINRRDFDTGQTFVQISGEHDLFGDSTVTVFPTLGHTPGHQSMRIRLASGHVVLAGDCCYLKRSLDLLRVLADQL